MHHGWLTPAAPGCTTPVRCEKRYSRCTNARFQERRVSARRGWDHRSRLATALARTPFGETLEQLPNQRAAKALVSTAVGRTPTALAWAFGSPRGHASSVSPRTFASRHHGWLTPAAPGCTRWHPLNVWRKFFGPICVRRCKYGSRTTAGSHPLVHPFTFASVAVAVGPVADGQSRGCGCPAIFPDSCSADAAILCTDRCGRHCNSK
jgi:hypothetical protein